MKCFTSTCLFVIFIVSLCEAYVDWWCLIYDEKTKSLEKYCEKYKETIPKNCSDTLTIVVNPLQVSRLKIGGCDPFVLLLDIDKYRNVSVLDISHSGYDNLDWFDIHLKRLKKFIGSHNQIQEIMYFLEHATEVTEIDLSHNKLWLMDAMTFGRLEQLRKIDLSYNAISSMHFETFKDSSRLELIDVSNNGLYDVPVFPLNKQLKVLRLEKNKIPIFSCFQIDIMRTVSVRLSWQNVKSFYGDACASKNLHVIRNSTIQGIVVNASGKFELHCNAQSFQQLKHFKAGHRSFSNVQDLTHCFGGALQEIDFSGNFVGTINTTTFRKFTNLRQLSLSDTLLTGFNFDALKSLKQLKILNISNNKLKYINNSLLLTNYTLEKFFIAGNELENVPELLHYVSPSVDALDLSGNYLGKLNATTFERFTALNSLNLSNTMLSFTNENPFEPLLDLQFLSISHNNLEHTNFSIIANTLKILSEFNVAHCHIKNVTDIVRGLGDPIAKLDLSYNEIEDVDFAQLSINLRHLNLEGNNLNDLHDLTKLRFRWLESLAIARNQLQCAYLKEYIKYEKYLHLIGEHWMQKPNKDCRSTKQGIVDFLDSVYDRVKFW